MIGRAGTGVDNVDVEAATARGILVCNAPKSNALSAAEHAIALMLALARNIPQAHAALVDGRWERSRFSGVELADKTLAVIGFGRIGQLVAARARALGMRVVTYDPFVSAERVRERGAELAETIEEAVADADWVTLHLPATAETRHLVGADLIAQMRPGVRIVNAARGELVDAVALADALESGHVAGAALDVFESEPTHRVAAVRAARRRRHAAPRRLDGRGAGPRRHDHRRAGRRARSPASCARTRSTCPTSAPRTGPRSRPYMPLAEKLGRVAVALADGGIERHRDHLRGRHRAARHAAR